MYDPSQFTQLACPLVLTNVLGMNCEKNAVVCEGYHEKQIWKSGKEKAEEGTFYQTTTV